MFDPYISMLAHFLETHIRNPRKQIRHLAPNVGCQMSCAQVHIDILNLLMTNRRNIVKTLLFWSISQESESKCRCVLSGRTKILTRHQYCDRYYSRSFLSSQYWDRCCSCPYSACPNIGTAVLAKPFCPPNIGMI